MASSGSVGGPRRAEDGNPAWRSAAAVLALGAILAVGTLPLLTGTAAPAWDAAAYYSPAVSLIGDFARAGRLLTWDPWVGGGRPACADPQSGTASPLVILAALVGSPPLGGFLIYWLGSWLFGGIGVLVLGRRLGAPPWARICCSAAFVACGYFTGHGQHTSIVFAFATLPWFVWCLDRAIAGRSLLAALQAGAVWGLAGLSGYPALVIIHGLYGGAWALGRLFLGGSAHGDDDGDAQAAEWRRPLAWSLLAGGLIVATALVVLSPTYVAFFTEGRAATSRTAPLSRYWAVERGALDPSALITFASPKINALGSRTPPGTLYQGEQSMVGLYLSPAVLALALVALVPLRLGPRRRTAWSWWLQAVGAGCLAAALGGLLPVRGWLYDLVPMTRYFRFPALFRGYAIFTLVVLALEAGRALGRRPPRRAWVAIGTAASALGVVALWTAARAAGRVGEPMALLGWGGWTALAWLGPAAVALAAALAGRRSSSGGIGRLAIGALVVLTLADAAVAIRLSEPLFATRRPRHLRQWQQLEQLHRARVSPLPGGLYRRPRTAWGNEDNRNQIPKQATFSAYDQFRNRYHRAWCRNEELTALVTGSDRTWFGERALPFTKLTPPPGSDEPSLLRIPTPDLGRFARRSLAVGGLLPVIHPVPGRPVDGPLFERTTLEQLPPMERLPVKVLEARPDLLGLRIEAPSAGWLVVTDRYSPGWRATVDGQPAPIHEAAFLFRAVAIPGPGRHDVRFRFRPTARGPLLVASWSVLATVLLLAPALAAWRRRLAMLAR